MQSGNDHEGDLHGQEDGDDDDEHEGSAVGIPLPLVLLPRWSTKHLVIKCDKRKKR